MYRIVDISTNETVAIATSKDDAVALVLSDFDKKLKIIVDKHAR